MEIGLTRARMHGINKLIVILPWKSEFYNSTSCLPVFVLFICLPCQSLEHPSNSIQNPSFTHQTYFKCMQSAGTAQNVPESYLSLTASLMLP